MTLNMEFHRGVRTSSPGTWRTVLRAPHFAQGSLDQACGPCSVVAALLILGVVTRAEINTLKQTGNSALHRFWGRAAQEYFRGTTSLDLCELLTEFSPAIDVERNAGATKSVVRKSRLWLKDGSVALLALDFGQGSGHWVLAAGTEQYRGSSNQPQNTAILCIDSAVDKPKIVPTNARLELRLTSESWAHLPYHVQNGDPRLVRCREAIRISATGLSA